MNMDNLIRVYEQLIINFFATSNHYYCYYTFSESFVIYTIHIAADFNTRFLDGSSKEKTLCTSSQFQ